MIFGVLFSGSSVHLQTWKVWLCKMKNSNKIREKSERTIGMVVDDVEGALFTFSIHENTTEIDG